MVFMRKFGLKEQWGMHFDAAISKLKLSESGLPKKIFFWTNFYQSLKLVHRMNLAD